jgi:thiol-disulfide isomerase/thioredoxin
LGEGAEERHAVEALKISLAIYSQTEWLNSPKLTVVDLREKVVLVQFWTYTCINWLRTLSYVCAWAKRYKDQGLVVIGVHTPEFAFEKDADNVHVLTVSR